MIITHKHDNLIEDMFTDSDFMPNGYPRNIKENRAYPTSMFNYADVADIPGNVEAGSWYYSADRGFYKYPIAEELVREIKDEAIAEVQEGAKNG